MTEQVMVMTEQEWQLWDRVFAQTMFEVSPRYSSGTSALQELRSNLWDEPISEKEWPSVEERIKLSGRVADIAIAERRKRG